MKKQCALFVALFLAFGNPLWSGSESIGFTAVAQTGKASGVVKDANGEPLIGATVMVKGTNSGVSTDANGAFSIKANPGQTLVVSYVGHKSKEVKAGNGLNVTLESSSTDLDEVVITAEFGLKRVARTVGSSVQNIKATDVAESGRTDFISALQGRVSGMTVTSSSGAPGASTSVVLRNVTSISGNNQPLYVIDGVPMNNSTFDPSTGLAVADDVSGLSVRSQDYSSRGNDFNPEDIESMTVLKGAAAAALYGSDASNGAIIITTKKGAKGRARITYSNQFSWSKAYGWPEMQNKYMNGAYGATNQYYTSRYGAANTQLFPFYDNVEAVLQTGFLQKHNVSLEAGDDKKSVRVSYSYMDQDGVIKTTSLKRQNLSVSGRAEINKYVSFEGSIQYVHQENDKALRGTSGPIYRSYRWPTTDDMSKYMAEDGMHMKYPNYYTDTDMLNPLFGLYKNLNTDLTDRFISSLSVNITPTKNTFVRASFGWDVSATSYEYGTHPYYCSNNQTAENTGSYSLVKYNTNDPTLNILAGWNDTFFNNKFNVGLQVGYHQQEEGVNSLASYGSNFLVIDFFSINNCDASTITSKKTSTKRRLQAISGQAEFGYNNMAFATFRFRNDWSSTLPTNNNTFFYPAVELSFIASELAPIRENLPWLNYLKLRGSYAQVGKDAPPLSIDPQLETTGLTGGGYKYGFTGPNKALKPEMNTSKEIGFEFRALDNRLDGDFTYFWTNCDDQIVTGMRLSYATGFVLNNMNVGSFKTWGWEGRLSGDIIKTRDWTWNLGVTASHSGSEVTSLPESVSEYYNAYTWNTGNIRNGIMVGHPITTLTGLAFQRNEKGDILISPSTGQPLVDSEWSVVGDREPKIRFGITTAVQYKNFRLSAMFAGRLDATVANGTSRDMLSSGFSWESVDQRESGYKIFTGVLKDGKENTANPTYSTIAMSNAQSSAYTGSDENWVQDGVHYLRCQELRLNYSIPSSFLEKVTKGHISRASVYVSGNDLFTITNYNGTDAVGNTMSAAAGGNGGEGIDVWGLPSPRSYTCGLSVTF